MVIRVVSQIGNFLKRDQADPDIVRTLYDEPSPKVRAAMIEIYKQYGHVVEDKFKTLRKYGVSRQVQQSTETLIMTNKTGVFAETLATGNTIDKVTVAGGYTGTFNLEYHTIDGNGDFTFGVQQVAVTSGSGTLSVPCARVSRAEDFSAALTGDLYVYKDSTVTANVPDDGTKIHMKVEQAANHSLKAATTISSVDYWVIEGIYGSVNTKTQAFANTKIWTRNGDGVPEIRFEIGMINGTTPQFGENNFLIVKPNEDVYVTATADQNGRAVSFGMFGRLLTIRA